MKSIFSRILVLSLLLTTAWPVCAHNGPPFPIISNRRVGPVVISLWTHPDIGIGLFYVMVDPPPGGQVPKDLKVQIGIQPVSGRLPEKFYTCRLQSNRGQVEYETEVNFDKQDMFRARLVVESEAGRAEAAASVEATPTGLGRWDLLWYASPFLGVGFLWFRALMNKRKRAPVATA